MKYKGLILGFLLLLSIGIIAMPGGQASQFVVPSLFVTPPDTTFYGPCVKSTTFNIDVILWNHPLSGVDVYAFDFYIDWFAGVSLVKATYHSPWPSFFEVVNGTSGPKTYHLAITAIPPSTGLFDVNMSVLTLTFHVDKDLCWPDTLTGTFHIHDVKMGSDGTDTVPIVNMEIDDGTYHQYSVQPNIELTSTAANATSWIIEKCVSHTFDVEVDLSNITNVYGFSFTLKFDPTHLETDEQKVTFKAAFPPPYESLHVYVTSGEVHVNLVRPSEKPAVCGAVVPAVDIVFHTIDTADGAGIIPKTSITKIGLGCEVFAKCPEDRVYQYGYGNGLLLYGGSLKYYFKPSRYDLNLDCVVDVQDMKALVPYYGTTTVAGGYGDVFNEGAHFVDIFDFVAISKYFGPVDP